MESTPQFIILLVLLILGYLFGSYREKRHFRDLQKREKKVLNLPVSTFSKQALPDGITETKLLTGSVVISIDYFKKISAMLRNLVGGRVIVYESLLDRSRREAILRMQEEAIEWGASQVLNVRLETVAIGGRFGGKTDPGSVEVIAYGTGIKGDKMSIKYVEKPIKDVVVTRRRHPIINFIYLLTIVVVVSGIIFMVLGYTASWLTTKISPDNENRVGNILYNTISETEVIDDRRIYYLDELLQDMLNVEENLRIPLKIHLLDTDIVNAAIIPGGHVLINTGLLREVKSENELAFVLAHELGHFQNKDPLKSLGRSLVVISALAAAGIGTSSSSEGLSSVVSWTGEFTMLHYSRNQETEADEYGLARVVNHYGHGGHSLDFFDELKKSKAEGFPQVSKYFSSHPKNQERIDYLNELAIQQGWNMNGEMTPLPDWLHCPDMDEQQCEDDI